MHVFVKWVQELIQSILLGPQILSLTYQTINTRPSSSAYFFVVGRWGSSRWWKKELAWPETWPHFALCLGSKSHQRAPTLHISHLFSLPHPFYSVFNRFPISICDRGTPGLETTLQYVYTDLFVISQAYLPLSSLVLRNMEKSHLNLVK